MGLGCEGSLSQVRGRQEVLVDVVVVVGGRCCVLGRHFLFEFL
jgi:hypothetical protein